MTTIIDGTLPGQMSQCSSLALKLAEGSAETNPINYFALNQLNIKQCTGCWNCWWKTPGVCAITDDVQPIMKSVIHSDMVIFASPIIAGFTSSLLKKLQDRLVALIHPYIELREGECHHRKRYDKYPDFALILGKEKDTDDEDIQIITDIYKRMAINFHCKLKHIWFTDTHKLEDIAHELSHN